MADDLLWDLLARWEEVRLHGEEIPVEQLCQDRPELLEPLRQHVQALKRMDWLLRPAQESVEEPDDFKPFVVGQYTVVGRIGSGGMGEVFRALHRRMERFVALKLLPPSLHQEVRSAAKLSHPNIVTAFDAGEHKGQAFLVMELVDGSDLQQHVQEKGPLPVEQAVDFIIQAARGLGFAHEKGIVHRDVKPANLILSADGTIKVLDLGLAHSGQDTSGIAGTVDYLAPEQTEEPFQADPRSDIYSLGCTLHFLLTGKPVYDGRTALEKILAHRERPAPPLRQAPALDAVFQKMVAKRPEDRFQSMAEVIEALEKVTTPQRSAKKVWWIAGLLVLILSGLSLYQFVLLPGFSPQSNRHQRDTAKDRKAAEWVLKGGGKVTIVPLRNSDPVQIVALQDLPPQPFILTGINLDRTQADDAGLAHLAGMDDLENLRLNYTRVTDAGMVHLRGLPKLKLLELAFTKVGDEGMASVSTLKELRWLALDKNPVTDKGLVHLQNCKKLESLRLNRLTITDDGLKSLEGLLNLNLLELVSTKVTDDGLASLSKLPRLRTVILAETQVTEAGKAKLRAELLKGSP